MWCPGAPGALPVTPFEPSQPEPPKNCLNSVKMDVWENLGKKKQVIQIFDQNGLWLSHMLDHDGILLKTLSNT